MTDEPRNYCEMMDFPDTFDEFANQYGFKDKDEVYTNGSELIPVYRVKQWLEHINKTTTMIDKSNFSQEQYKADLQSAYDCGYEKAKDNLAVDCISKEEAIKTIQRYGVGCFDADEFSPEECERFVIAKLNELPSVTPIIPKGHWIDGHCSECGCDVPAYIIDWKWQKDMDAKYCPMCGADMKEGDSNV